MERAALLRSISCSTLACNRFFLRSSNRLSRSSASFSSSLSRVHHRSFGTLTRRSVLRRHWRLISGSSSIPSARCFSSLVPKAIATSPEQASSGDSVHSLLLDVLKITILLQMLVFGTDEASIYIFKP